MNSMGHTAVASMPPAMHPAAIGVHGFFFLGAAAMVDESGRVLFSVVLTTASALLGQWAMLCNAVGRRGGGPGATNEKGNQR